MKSMGGLPGEVQRIQFGSTPHFTHIFQCIQMLIYSGLSAQVHNVSPKSTLHGLGSVTGTNPRYHGFCPESTEHGLAGYPGSNPCCHGSLDPIHAIVDMIQNPCSVDWLCPLAIIHTAVDWIHAPWIWSKIHAAGIGWASLAIIHATVDFGPNPHSMDCLASLAIIHTTVDCVQNPHSMDCWDLWL
jgi:hypothetical protein